MDEDHIKSLIDHLPLSDLEKEVISLLRSNDSEEKIIEGLIKKFEND
jgi:hypothetical protein